MKRKTNATPGDISTVKRKTPAYTPNELRKILLGRKQKAIRLVFAQYPYFEPTLVEKMISEIEMKAIMATINLDGFSACERMIYRLLCESAELTG